MSSIVTPQTMRDIDRTYLEEGTSESELILRAASEIAHYVDNAAPENRQRPRSVIAVAGPGSNGVDAIVAAALLVERGWSASALLVLRNELPAFPAVEQHLSSIEIVEEIATADVILDGIFGNSERTDLPEDVLNTVGAINAARSQLGVTVFAIDCPTGTNALTGETASAVVSADVTLCISNAKVGLLRRPASDHIGELELLDIGLPVLTPDADVRAVMIQPNLVKTCLPQRRSDAHKSSVGGVLIVGGAPNYFGAPRLAGEAALRSGAGYVGLAVPRSIVASIASAVPEIVFLPTTETDGRKSAEIVRKAVDDHDRYSSIVVGPGLGSDEVTRDLLHNLFGVHEEQQETQGSSTVFGIPRRSTPSRVTGDSRLSRIPWVIDADGLNWLSAQDDWVALLRSKRCVLTPHPGEMARLLGVDQFEDAADPWDVARSAAVEWGQVIVLKGGFTCVATPDGYVYVAPRATVELATPGTGDVLAGMIGAFLAQGCSPTEAATLSVYLGSMAGKDAKRRFGVRSVIARNLIDGIPQAIVGLEQARLQRNWD